MRVIVDETLCEANGFCESLAPDSRPMPESRTAAHRLTSELPCARSGRIAVIEGAPSWVKRRVG